MSIEPNRLLDAIAELSAVPGFQMGSLDLAQDVFFLSGSFPEPDDFADAVASTRTVLEQLVAGR